MMRYAAWIACLAILMAALAPSISHAIGTKKDNLDVLHEICTVEGVKTIVKASHDAEHQAPVEKSTHLDHCPFCLTSSASFALLPETFSLPILIGNHIAPPLFYQSSCPLFAWVVAQPRAPPFLS